MVVMVLRVVYKMFVVSVGVCILWYMLYMLYPMVVVYNGVDLCYVVSVPALLWSLYALGAAVPVVVGLSLGTWSYRPAPSLLGLFAVAFLLLYMSPTVPLPLVVVSLGWFFSWVSFPFFFPNTRARAKTADTGIWDPKGSF